MANFKSTQEAGKPPDIIAMTPSLRNFPEGASDRQKPLANMLLTDHHKNSELAWHSKGPQRAENVFVQYINQLRLFK